jgi:hypothetical protein
MGAGSNNPQVPQMRIQALSLPSAVILLLAIVSAPVWAGETGDWFKSLHQPVTGVSCCDISDCRSTTARQMPDGHWEASLDQKWVSIPPDKIIADKVHPAGEAVICANPAGIIYCFTRPGAGG